jgi:hypothetical protein
LISLSSNKTRSEGSESDMDIIITLLVIGNI